MIRKLLRAAAVAVVAACTLALSGPVDAAEASTTVHGCSAGYFCIYASTATYNAGQPSYTFYTYGAHNIYNQYGVHWVFNHQTGGAQSVLCEGWNGNAPADFAISNPNYAYQYDLSPINSIVLDPALYNGPGMVASSCATDAHNQGWYR